MEIFIILIIATFTYFGLRKLFGLNKQGEEEQSPRNIDNPRKYIKASMRPFNFNEWINWTLDETNVKLYIRDILIMVAIGFILIPMMFGAVVHAFTFFLYILWVDVLAYRNVRIKEVTSSAEWQNKFGKD